MSTYTSQNSPTDSKFYEYEIVAQVYGESCPKIASSHWLLIKRL